MTTTVDWPVCEECDRRVPAVHPVYSWDHNSLQVCDACSTAINNAHPEGDSQMTTTTNTTTPRVWVGCLACYSAGRLTGDWVDAVDAADYIPCPRIDANGPHEEFWVFDHEGFHGLIAGECSPSEAQEVAEAIDGFDDPAAVAAYWNNWHTTGTTFRVDDFDQDGFTDAYCGVWDTFADYADQLADDILDMGSWPDLAARYFDWDAWRRDLAYDYDTDPAPNGGVYVFRQG